MTTIKLNVAGMSCQGCADSLARRFKQESGISDASVSFDQKAAEVSFDPNEVNEARLNEIVAAAGFSVQ
jgi:copper chaperone CopZ